jgi:parvulin-like peptidyl-prolyl isomerase
MTKRSDQTTGMPKGNEPKAAPTGSEKRQPRLLGEYKSRHEREAAIQRYIIIGAVVISALAILLVVVALVFDQLIRPQQSVATVNGQNITVGDFERRVRLERTLLNQQLTQGMFQVMQFSPGIGEQEAFQQLVTFPPYDEYYNEMTVPDQLGNRVLNDMVDEALIRQQAAERGITVSAEQIDEEVQTFFGFDPNRILLTPTATLSPTPSPTPFITATPSPVPSATPTATVTPTLEFTHTPSPSPVPSGTPTATVEPTLQLATAQADFESLRGDFNSYVTTAGNLSDADVRSFFEIRALRAALEEQISAETARTAPFVNARHILVTTQEAAQDVLEALQAGESFSDLAAAVSQDGSNSRGGELGWSPISNYVEPFANAVRDAEIGVFVGPVETEFGWHIIQVRAREEREMSDSEFEAAKTRTFLDWLENLREEQTASIQIFDTWIDNVPTDPPLQLTN